MKRTLFTMLILFLAISMLAAQPGRPGKDKPAHKISRGIIQSVTLADAALGTRPEVTVVNAQNKRLTFLVMSTTTLSGADGKALTMDKLQAGQKIRISYRTTPENVQEALSIHILK